MSRGKEELQFESWRVNIIFPGQSPYLLTHYFSRLYQVDTENRKNKIWKGPWSWLRLRVRSIDRIPE